jgi:hypothetical protein
MTRIVSPFSFTAIVLGVLLHTGVAEATSARTWVSGSGDDANPCTSALPCATFQHAYGVTSAGGEIDVLDGGDFGPLVIRQALTVANDGAGTAAITPTFTAVYINAGPTDAIVLRGLTLNGINTTNGGVYFAAGASLLIQNCKIQGFQNAAGIEVTAQDPSHLVRLSVTDTVLSNDGRSTNGSIWLVSAVGAATTSRFERVQIFNGIGNGIRADGTFGAGPTDVELHDVAVDGAAGGSGIVAVSPTSGGAPVTIMADEVTSSHNAGYGLRAVGGTASIYLSRSTITDNSVGIRASSGGAIVSYSDNRFANNSGGDGSPTSVMGLK